MPTDISVTSRSRRAPSRMWLASPQGTEEPKHAVLDFTKFNHANFTATGDIRNGCVLGLITATGKYGPYEPGATDGRQKAAGFVFNDNAIPADAANAVVTDAFLERCSVRVSGLPYKTGPGSLDAAARTALTHAVFYG